MAFRESRWRSLTKSVTFRILVMMADAVIIFIITGSYLVATSVIIFSNFSSTIIYIVHERIWNRIKWGKRR